MSTVGIITPFYQRKRGLLARALRGVSEQESTLRLQHVIVDDSSPAPAAAEAAEVPAGAVERHILTQPNAGPAAARNRALEYLTQREPQPDYIAFLDSDDYWTTRHLRVALAGLAHGGDFYFCNRTVDWTGQTGEQWRADKYFPAHSDLEPGLQRIEGGLLRLVMSSLVHTSGVVYRLAPFAAHRFNPLLRFAEDYAFFLHIMSRGAGVVYGTEPNVQVGKGLDVNPSWTEPASLRLHRNLGMMLRKVLADCPLEAADIAFAERALRRLDHESAATIMYLLRKGPRGPAWAELRERPNLALASLRLAAQKFRMGFTGQ